MLFLDIEQTNMAAPWAVQIQSKKSVDFFLFCLLFLTIYGCDSCEQHEQLPFIFSEIFLHVYTRMHTLTHIIKFVLLFHVFATSSLDLTTEIMKHLMISDV